MRELVSVIIPVYNVEKYLRECIDSVLKQSYENMEILLIDDGATDLSGEICDEYELKDNRIRVIHQENQGLSGARNTGFYQAKGKYVYFLDSDDWIIPETIELLYEKAEQEKADIVFFEALTFEDGKPENVTAKGYSYKNTYETEKGIQVFRELQKNKEYHSAVPLLFINKSVMKKLNLCFEQGILYEDMLFTFELFCRVERVVQLKKSLYRRRYRSNSIVTSKKTKKNFSSAYTVYKKVEEISSDLDILEEDCVKQYICRCAFNTFNYYRALSKPERKECLKIYQQFRQDVLENNAYGNRALKMRCYGYMPWVIYKLFEKVFVTGMKGTK